MTSTAANVNTSSGSSRSKTVTILAIICCAVLLLGSIYLSRTCGVLIGTSSSSFQLENNNKNVGSSSSSEQQKQQLIDSDVQKKTKGRRIFSQEEIEKEENRFRASIRTSGKEKEHFAYLSPREDSCPFHPGNGACLSSNNFPILLHPPQQQQLQQNEEENTKSNINNNNNNNNSENKSRTTKRTRTKSCCCCCWSPHRKSCAGHFEETPVDSVLKDQIYKSKFFHSSSFGTSKEELKQAASKACPWWDRGFWRKPIPSDFMSLSHSEASKVVQSLCGCSYSSSSSSFQTKNKNKNKMKHEKARNGIGLMFLWELGRMTVNLRPNSEELLQEKLQKQQEAKKLIQSKTKKMKKSSLYNNNNNNNNNSTENETIANKEANARKQQAIQMAAGILPPNQQQQQQQSSSSSSSTAPGGVLVFSGDSMTRQLFSRLVHNIRSRECDSDAEMRRSGVFELQIHETAAYVATTIGDMYMMARNCEDGLNFLELQVNQSKIQPRPRVLLRACFVWDNTPAALFGTMHNLHLLKDKVAALVFFPMIWWCGLPTNDLCLHANQSNGAALSVIGTAVHYSIPRIVICTNAIRQHFGYFQLDKVKMRNEQLSRLFPYPTRVPFIKTMGQQEQVLSSSSNNNNNKNTNNNNNFWTNVRLYDFSRRHDVLAPEQCDVIHGMCMFLPARDIAIPSTPVKALFGGTACPGNIKGAGSCQDMGNFVLLKEILFALEVEL